MGNRRSVEKALIHIGAEARISSDPRVLGSATGLVLPGVGAFARGMENLRIGGLAELLRSRVSAGTPLLGICLGMQLLFDASTELGGADGLGLIPGQVRGIQAGGLRVPHIGWNDVSLERPAAILETGAPFYHVHSFAAHPDDPADVVGTTEYGERFTTVVQRDNVYGVQFHPEKSSTDGLALLKRFAEVAA
ncbi:MAG: imidazole glycerol phosphate synthase subunit HisH [Solirubrobacterales bacterium]|nr:imidazole glycerol phosphate synthase subunit HisH [Solirubrobacterales bacterium]